MILISHRGNIDGPNPNLENKPSYILEAINKGYDCEVDFWFRDGKFILGHDEPQYEIPFEFIKNYYRKLWIHCKNKEALEKLYSMYSMHTMDLSYNRFQAQITL